MEQNRKKPGETGLESNRNTKSFTDSHIDSTLTIKLLTLNFSGQFII